MEAPAISADSLPKHAPGKNKTLRMMKKNIFFYILLAPAILVVFVFSYIPMPGIIMAFMDYNPFEGFFGSPWAGLKHFKMFFSLPDLNASIWNTFKLSALGIIFTFPCPIILALLFNELRTGIFKRVLQTVSYLPNFLSWLSIIGLAMQFYDSYGTLNNLRIAIFGPETERIMYASLQEFFLPNIILLTIWKGVGWGSIVFLAAISSIDAQLYESAKIDGANRWKQTWYITLPGMAPMITIFLILSMGGLFGSNFELVYGLQNPFINYETLETVIYKHGVLGQNYSMGTAVGFMQGMVAFILVAASNKISKSINGIGII